MRNFGWVSKLLLLVAVLSFGYDFTHMWSLDFNFTGLSFHDFNMTGSGMFFSLCAYYLRKI